MEEEKYTEQNLRVLTPMKYEVIREFTMRRVNLKEYELI